MALRKSAAVSLSITLARAPTAVTTEPSICLAPSMNGFRLVMKFDRPVASLGRLFPMDSIIDPVIAPRIEPTNPPSAAPIFAMNAAPSEINQSAPGICLIAPAATMMPVRPAMNVANEAIPLIAEPTLTMPMIAAAPDMARMVVDNDAAITAILSIFMTDISPKTNVNSPRIATIAEPTARAPITSFFAVCMIFKAPVMAINAVDSDTADARVVTGFSRFMSAKTPVRAVMSPIMTPPTINAPITSFFIFAKALNSKAMVPTERSSEVRVLRSRLWIESAIALNIAVNTLPIAAVISGA